MVRGWEMDWKEGELFFTLKGIHIHSDNPKHLTKELLNANILFELSSERWEQTVFQNKMIFSDFESLY